MPPTVGEGMTGSRYPGLPSGTEPGTWTPCGKPATSNPTHRRSHADTDPDRLTEHASPDAGVKATPLRGRPSGPRLDPDAATTRPTPGGHGKERGQPARPHGLTGPTPSGMTCENVGAACGVACGNRTHDLRITRTTGGIPGTPT